MSFSIKKLLPLVCLAFVCQFGFSQNSLTTANGSYAENFDVMGATGTNYPPNWSAIRYAGTGTPTNAVLVPVASEGSATGAAYNVGTAGSTDRALGTLASGATVPAFGTSFQNNTGSTILDFSFSGVMEQWRSATNAALDERVLFEYSTNATSLSTGTWTAITTMDLVEKLTTTTTAANVNGNLSANQTAISGTATAVNLGTGSTLWIRWRDTDNVGNDGLYAIDNFTLNYTNGGADNTPPTLSSLNPADNAIEVPVNQTFSISFSENVKKGTGNIYLKKTADGSTVQMLDVTNAAVTISNNVASFIFNSLALSTGFYIEVDNGAIQDIAGNNFAGISGSTAWNFTTTSTFLSYNFNTCVSYAPVPNGFTQYSVVGDSLWKCTGFGNNGTGGVQMNGFVTPTASNDANEDWLISPALDLSGTTIPLLRFYSINRFAGPQLRLLVSTNYTPGNAPATATWTELNGKFPGENSNVWTLSDSISLAPYTQANVFVAWVYTSTTVASARWTLDDVSLFNSTIAPSPNITLSPASASFGYTALGSNSAWRAFTFSSSNFTGSLTLAAPAGFQISRDSIAPSTTIVFTQAEANAGGIKTFYVRFVPDAADKNYSTALIATSTGYNKQIVAVSGTSLSNTKTLEVVNWNMEWFGSTEAGFGPDDNELQEANARKILRYLDADLYALVEIVDTARFRRLADSLGTDYGYVVSTHGTRAINPAAPNYNQFYPSAQKEGFIYKKSVFSNVTARTFLKTNNNDTLNPSSYYWWSSGRFPYIMEADATIDGQTKRLSFVLVHAKANTGNDAEKVESYNRRKAGYLNMKDTLDLNFATANVIILGDLNDGPKRTIAPIATGPDTATSFIAFVADSTDANSYKTLTLPFAGTGSTTSFSETIDNVIISNELVPFYINGSAEIRRDVTSQVTNYATTTTDHYPIFSRYYFAQTPLPVTLLSFKGYRSGAVSQLQWQVSKEVNTDRYVVERSIDGRRFSTIGTIMATATGNNVNQYSFTDAAPIAGNNFYRLRIIDKDGKTTISPIVKVYFGNAWQITVSPNPVRNVLYVQSSQAGKMTVSLYDAAGRKAKQFARLSFAEGETKPFSITGIAKGIYTIEMQAGNSRQISKLIIE